MDSRLVTRISSLVAVNTLLVLGTGAAQAQSLSLNPTALGNIRRIDPTLSFPNGTFFHRNDAHFIGQTAINPSDIGRAYFVFNLTGLSFTVTGAELRITSPGGTGADITTETIQIRDFTTSIPNMTGLPVGSSINIDGPPGIADPVSFNRATTAYADLADGTLYGSVNVTAANVAAGNLVTIGLAGAVPNINTQGTGLFAVGMTLSTLSGTSFQEGMFANNTTAPNIQLFLTGSGVTASAPEPGTWIFIIVGGVLIYTSCRRR